MTQTKKKQFLHKYATSSTFQLLRYITQVSATILYHTCLNYENYQKLSKNY